MTERNRGLDGLRGISIWWVMGYHLFGFGVVHPWVAAVPGVAAGLKLGWLGVTGFFVLSGYLITAHLVAERGRPDYWRRFAVKRAARILPAYALLLLSLPLAEGLWRVGHDPELFNGMLPFWSHVLLVQNGFMATTGYLGNAWLRVTWSLAVEVQYYGFIALLVAWCPPSRLRFALVVLTLGALVTRYGLYVGVENASTAMLVLPMSRMDSFALGGLVALMAIGPWSGRARIGFAGVGLAGAGAFLVFANGGFGAATWGLVPAYYTAVSVALAVLVGWVGAVDGRLARWLGWGPLVEAGRLSYFMYLFHMPVAWIVYDGMAGKGRPESASDGGLARAGIVVAVTWGLALLSRRWIETPAIAVGRRWLRRRGAAE